MGMDFVALLKCPDWTKVMHAVRSLERASPPAAQEVAELSRSCGYAEPTVSRPVWVTADLDLTHVSRPTLPTLDVDLLTPEDFHLTFGADAVAVGHVLRWRVFMTEPEWQKAMLGACREFAQLLGATEGIVTSDHSPVVLGFLDGLCFDEALHRGQARDGEVSEWPELYDELDEHTWDPRGYWRFLKHEGSP